MVQCLVLLLRKCDVIVLIAGLLKEIARTSKMEIVVQNVGECYLPCLWKQ